MKSLIFIVKIKKPQYFMVNFSTDDRAVATSRAWLKRILVSWVILNVLGFIMAYLVNLTQGGAYVT